jgi:uncharacterized protein
MTINEDQLIAYFQGQPVIRAWLFGSQANGTATDDSDVDILVELDHSQPVGLRYVQMWMDLQQLLGKKVDLVSTGGISPFIRPFIDAQKILFYERG